MIVWPWLTFHGDPGSGEDLAMFIDGLTFDLACVLHIKLADEEWGEVVVVGHVILPAMGQFFTLQVPTG